MSPSSLYSVQNQPNFYPTASRPYLQEVSVPAILFDEQTTPKVLALVCAPNAAISAGTDQVVWRFTSESTRWEPLWNVESDLNSLRWLLPSAKSGLWLGTMHNVCHFTAEATTILPISSSVAGLEEENTGELRYLLTRDAFLDRITDIRIALPDDAAGRVLALLADGTPAIGTDRGLWLYRERALHPLPPESRITNNQGRLLSLEIQALAADSQNGLWVEHRSVLTTIRQEPGKTSPGRRDSLSWISGILRSVRTARSGSEPRRASPACTKENGVTMPANAGCRICQAMSR